MLFVCVRSGDKAEERVELVDDEDEIETRDEDEDEGDVLAASDEQMAESFMRPDEASTKSSGC